MIEIFKLSIIPNNVENHHKISEKRLNCFKFFEKSVSTVGYNIRRSVNNIIIFIKLQEYRYIQINKFTIHY